MTQTVSVCEIEYYSEFVDASGQFVQFENEQDMIDSYLRTYGTEENYLRAFGGQVEVQEPRVDT